MLQYIRKQKHRVVGILIASVMALTMVAFGVDSFSSYRHRENREVAVTIDKEEITYNDYSRRLRDITDKLRRQYPQAYSQIQEFFNPEQQAIDSIIAERLLYRIVANLGLTASARRIEEQILSLPFFGGKYSDQSFRLLLQSKGLSAEELENQIRSDLAITQLRGAFMDLSPISQAEARSIYGLKNSRYQFAYAEISTANFKDKVTADDLSKLEAFFKEKQEDYRKRASVRYLFIKFDPNDFEEKVDIINNDLAEAYEQRRSYFADPKQLHLREILLKRVISEDVLGKALNLKTKTTQPEQTQIDPNDEKKKKAELIVDRLKNGESFEQIAKTESESETTRESGGDLGWRTLQDLSPEVRSAVDSLVTGEFSKVIDTPDGFRIVYLVDEKQPRQKSFDEVKSILERELRLADAPIYAYAAAEEFLSRFEAQAEKESFADFAKRESLSLADSGGLLELGTEPQGAPAGLTEKALSVQETQAQVVQVESTPFVIFVSEKRESEIPALSAVRDRVEADYRKARATELAEDHASKLLQTAKERKVKLSEVAKLEKLEIKITEEATVETMKDPVISSPQIREVAFALSRSNALPEKPARRGDSFYVFELEKVLPPDLADFDKQSKDIVPSELLNSGNRAIMALVDSLKARADITLNPSLFEKNK